MPTLAVVTTFPPNRWSTYAKRMIDSHVQFWPEDVTLYAYYEGAKPDYNHAKVKFINTEEANPELMKFKQRHKDDPVANGETQEIPGGVRRDPNAGDNDKGKGSYLWDSIRFAHKTFAVDHALKNLQTDDVLWLDADTYTFRPISTEFFTGLLPSDKLVNFLGRGDKYPECGWVCYNRNHKKRIEFMEYWTNLYIQDTIFKELEWHDSYVFWQCVKRIAPNDGVDIGKGAGAKGHHVFVNSVLGSYVDHLKGKRKIKGKSSASDLRMARDEDYWKNVESYDPFGGLKFDPKK
ncbi:MAG: hypothetical protein EA442_01355 [Candidatus Nitrosopelagicus sp.]|nr:MAG: hypothetical protein EA442_01355 [Candidatus Nitrosopelagicus sp.]